MGEYFIFTIASFAAIVFIAIVKICFASKCDSINLCYGLCQIHRAVNLELSQIPNQSLQEVGNLGTSSPSRIMLQKILSMTEKQEGKSNDINYSSLRQMKNEKTLEPGVPSEQKIEHFQNSV